MIRGSILGDMRLFPALILLSLPAFGDTGARLDWIRKIGSGQEFYAGFGTDAQGNLYIAGNTRAADFPVKSPVQPTFATTNATDVFVVKLDSAGNVVYATCFGGTGEDAASAIAVDKAGNVYVTGLTYSSDFP